MIKVDDIYNATNEGLDIILDYYPQAKDCTDGKKKFKIRTNEITPSASLKKIKDLWRVTDFGGEGVALSGIDVCMKEESINFVEALYRLADRYNINCDYNDEINKPDIEQRKATEADTEGNFLFELNDGPTDSELKIFGPRVKAEHLIKYKYYSVKWYSVCKNRMVTIIKSNENYPIFLRDCGTFKKVYQPCNPKKEYRFFYNGDKPKDFVNGLAELQKAYKEYEEQQYKEKEGVENIKLNKLDEAVLCSGERDAMCVAALGYYPLWLNSESAELTATDYKAIMLCVNKLYNIPDIDSTGVKKGIQLGMKYLDIFTVWLPDWLKTYRYRGKPRKDFRDFCEFRSTTKDFLNLLAVAMPLRFWEYKTGERGVRLEINTEYAYYFLKCNGFGTIEDKNSKSGQMFVKIENNIVSEIKSKEIRAFFREFLKERYCDIDIRNLVNNSTRLSESSLENLDSIQLDFTDYTKDSQFLFFNNATWLITGNGIKEYKTQDVDRYVWKDELIDHKVKRLASSFSTSYSAESQTFDIDIKENDSKFFKFLINSSRVHWRKELESGLSQYQGNADEYIKNNRFNIAGELLSIEEIREQKQHLLNKIFAIGYLLHRYKDPHRAWCVFAMDNKIGEVGESNGRSGKSFGFKALRYFMKSVTLSGRNPKLTDNPHIYERVSEYTDMVIIDDADQYLNFNFFFDVVTGDMPVNPKNNRSYEIPFEKAPKFVITSNFTLRDIDASTEGRILYAVFSDYYHQKTSDNDYNETRTIFDDFGKNLFFDYSEDEWNADFNFFADCCAFYLSTINSHTKIQPPMDNVTKRNLMTIIGNQFNDWATVYFSEESENVNKLIAKEDVMKEFINATNVKGWTTQKFTKSLAAFCKLAPWIVKLNPSEMCNGQGRIIRTENGKTKEMLYIETTDPANVEFTPESDAVPF
jgi:hypothetical protein